MRPLMYSCPRVLWLERAVSFPSLTPSTRAAPPSSIHHIQLENSIETPNSLNAPPNNLHHDILHPLILFERNLQPSGRDTLAQTLMGEIMSRVAEEEEEEEGFGVFLIRSGGGAGEVGKGSEDGLDPEVDWAGCDGHGEVVCGGGGGYRLGFERGLDELIEVGLCCRLVGRISASVLALLCTRFSHSLFSSPTLSSKARGNRKPTSANFHPSSNPSIVFKFLSSSASLAPSSLILDSCPLLTIRVPPSIWSMICGGGREGWSREGGREEGKKGGGLAPGRLPHRRRRQNPPWPTLGRPASRHPRNRAYHGSG